MIEIIDFKKSYDEHMVLEKVNLNIKKGSIHGLIGSSGAGKSTLLRAINGIENFNGGNIFVMDKDISKLKENEISHFRKDIGMIFQNFALLERKNVFKNIALPLECWKIDKETIEKRVNELIDMVGISDKRDAMPKDLSGGQRQRVAIARALALEPKILLSDEATSGLDPITSKTILSLLKEINEKLGITIILVTHEMEVIKSLCDYMSIIEDQTVTLTGKVEDIFRERGKSLENLIGKKEFENYGDRILMRIFLTQENFENDVFYNLVDKYKIKYFLEDAVIDKSKNGKFGEFYISVDKGDLEKTIKALSEEKGLYFNVYEKGVEI